MGINTDLYILCYVYACFACVCLCVHRVCAFARGDQKRAFDPLEPELQMVVSPHMSAGIYCDYLVPS